MGATSLFVAILFHASMVVSGGAATTSLSLELGTASAFNRIGTGFVGFTLSFLTDQGANPDPLWRNTSIITIDLDDPDFNTLVSGLSPGLLRVGGGGEWPIVMDVDGNTCAKRQTPAYWCLTMARWRSILDFAVRNGVQLVWGLGAQNRVNGTSPLDFDLITPFLAYTASLGDGVLCSRTGGGGLLGFELGNELDGGDYTSNTQVAPVTFAADYLTLRGVIDLAWPRRGDVQLVGPAMHIQATWARRFLGALGRGVLDLFSFHDYAAYGPDPLLGRKIMDRDFQDAYWEQGAPTIETAKALQPGADVIVGETSAAWHSGQCGVTDRFNGCFWYASALGRLARGGVQSMCRHSFNGGCYAMINRTTMRPNPDYWIARMFGQLMDQQVLDIRPLLMPDATTRDKARNLLMYAHFSKRWPHGSSGKSGGAGAALLFVNLDPSETFSLSFSAAPSLMAPRYEFHLTGGEAGLTSDAVEVNGEALVYGGGASLPCIAKLGKFSNDTHSSILVAPESIVFVELPDATVY